MRERSFIPLFVTNLFGTMNDNFLKPRRKVTMHVENLTARTREWSRLSRLEFNRELEKWYNAEREVSSGAR